MFTVAEIIGGRTVDELSESMSVTEMYEWREYLKLKKQERDKQEREAKRKRR